VEFSVRSSLPLRHLEEVEELVFFNERQREVRSRILELLELYGPPQILRSGEDVRVGLVRRPDAQCLFLLSDETEAAELLGFALFLRDSADTLTVVHVAVVEGVLTEDEADPLLAMRLLNSIRRLAQRIRGVKWVRVLYGRGSETRLPVSSRSGAETQP